MTILENWSIVFFSREAKELKRARLRGNIYNDPRFENGKIIVSSEILRLEGEEIITYSNSKYKLGEVDPKYEKLFPNAKKRLFNAFKKEKEK